VWWFSPHIVFGVFFPLGLILMSGRFTGEEYENFNSRSPLCFLICFWLGFIFIQDVGEIHREYYRLYSRSPLSEPELLILVYFGSGNFMSGRIHRRGIFVLSFSPL